MRKREKKHGKILLITIFLLIIIAAIVYYFVGIRTVRENETILDTSSGYVITNKKVALYDEQYKEIGSIQKDITLKIKDNAEKNYLVVDNLDVKYYIKKENITPVKENDKIDDRYKNYIVFNENVVTQNKTDLYDEKGNLMYSLAKSYSLPIIVKETDKYGVEFGDRLVYIKEDDCTVVNNYNTKQTNTTGIATLNYHAFYDETNEEEKAACNTVICHSKQQFKEQLDLIREMNLLTLKMKEVEMYIDGKIQLPKSVLITIDDGGRTQIAVDMLTEYKMYATIFLVTSWYDPQSYYVTEYIELHSHSHDLHNVGACPTGQGGGIQCLKEEDIQNDLRISREKLNQTTYFCYPFYEYNDYSIKMLKEAGFTMAFVGESTRGDNLVKVGSDKFRLPRFVIVNYTTDDNLRNYFNGMK